MINHPISQLPKRFHRARRRGAALLEFVLVLPLLLAITFGTIEYGYAMYVKNTLQGAAREAARQAVVRDATTAEAQAAARQFMLHAFPSMNENDFTVTFDPPNIASADSGDTISATVRAPTWQSFGVQPLSGMTYFLESFGVQLGINANRRFSAGASMRKE